MKWKIIFLILFPIVAFSSSLDEAMEKYQAAERSKLPTERSALFNEALTIYLPYTKKSPSAELLDNIGNIYFYLGDNGLAIAYYRHALALSPRNEIVKKNLSFVIENAHVYGSQITSPVIDLLAFRWCSAYERTSIVIGALTFCFILFSMNVWFPSFGFRGLFIMMTFLTTILLISLSLYAIFMPIKAVVIRQTELRTSILKEEGASSVVLHPGEMVQILSYDPTQEWLRVQTVTGLPGYLSSNSLYCVPVN
jgi:tetratricopeptide (TPR) repeat protein